MHKPAILKLAIKTGDPRPIFKQIVDGISLAIASGELAVGDRLPSVRDLAVRLSVNPNTVARAYSELTAAGLLVSRQGTGLFVSPPRQMLSAAERRKRLREALERCIGDVTTLGYSNDELVDEFARVLGRMRKVTRAG